MELPVYRFGEELANSLSHGIGAVLSIVALVFAIVAAVDHGGALHVVSVCIYGATLVWLYLASTLYHSIWHRPTKRFFQFVDHTAILFLIAGTYTPFTLVTLQGRWGWLLFAIVWSLVLVGLIVKFSPLRRYEWLSLALYLVMGWLVVIALEPLLAALPSAGLWWLVAGGIAYTVGVIFYLWESLPYNHAIWHLFVLSGSVCHFFSVYFFVIPVPWG